jgi:chromosome segregation ATPase
MLLLLLTIPARAQSSSPDTQLTQALLTEIRQLRLDLQTTAATIQRIQIVMYRLQSETAIMNRATQRLDDARNRCTQAQSQKKMMVTQIEQAEERLRNAQNPIDRKAAEDMLGRIKPNLEMWNSEEQQCHSREADADSQFRAERAKMSELEDQLDKLDKALAVIGASPGRKP